MMFSSQNLVTFAVPVDQLHGGVVRQAVRQLLEAAGIPGDVAGDVILAVGEAFANAVAHGTGSRRERVGVSVEASTYRPPASRVPGTRRQVVIEMRYPGEPFDTRQPAAPLPDQLTGRGRYLMTSLMDKVTYNFPPGETIVRLEKNIEGTPGCHIRYCT